MPSRKARQPESPPRKPGSVPEDSPQHCLIHASVLFADLHNSVLLSSSMQPLEYDELINEFQASMLGVTRRLRRAGEPIAEYGTVGDELKLFFYDPQEVERNAQLDSLSPGQQNERQSLQALGRQQNERLMYSALLAAIELKNRWLVHPLNTARVLSQHEPIDLSIGIHFGLVYYRRRADRRKRIEGYAVNLAKRVQSAARCGRFSLIMLSENAAEAIRNAVRGHTQLRQRVFFHRHEVELAEMRGVLKSQIVYELKFYHRLGLRAVPEAIPLYEAIFAADPSNVWAYYQLADHYGYQLGQWERVLQLAHQAHDVHPADERVKYDLARCQMELDDLPMAREYCTQALALNPDFDLAYECLGRIAARTEDYATYIDCLRKAASLSPGSAANQLNLGLGLLQAGQQAEAAHYLRIALELWPEYRHDSGLIQALHELKGIAGLPAELQALAAEPCENRGGPANT